MLSLSQPRVLQSTCHQRLKPPTYYGSSYLRVAERLLDVDGIFRTVCRDCSEWQIDFEFEASNDYFGVHVSRGHDVQTVNLTVEGHPEVNPVGTDRFAHPFTRS